MPPKKVRKISDAISTDSAAAGMLMNFRSGFTAAYKTKTNAETASDTYAARVPARQQTYAHTANVQPHRSIGLDKNTHSEQGDACPPEKISRQAM